MDSPVKQGRLITEVRLGNFKSVVDQKVSLRPLTIVIGANSSGKSTLMQGLLLLAQAIESGATSPDVPLNGDLINLGYLRDVRHSQARVRDPLRIGVTAQFTPTSRFSPTFVDDYYPELDVLRQNRWDAAFDVWFGGVDGSDLVSPPVTSLRLQALPGPERSICLELKRRSSAPLVAAVDSFAPGSLPLSAESFSAFGGSIELNGVRRTTVVAAALKGLLPSSVLHRRSEHEALADLFFLFLLRYGYNLFVGEAEELVTPDKSDVSAFLDIARSRLNEWRHLPEIDRPRIEQFLRERLTRDELRRVAFEELYTRRSEYVRQLAKMLQPSARRTLPVRVRSREAALLQMAGAGIADTFRSLEHLGGLRAAPQPLYPTSNVAQRGHLGRDGEYTAAVLYALRDRPVSSFDIDGRLERLSLENAVSQWASRLGLFEEVAPHHRGALGIDITVRQTGVESQVDITAVGLGVSQLLPVLVRCLLSGPGDVVLLEQPELHLHPDSQQKLATFLLACVRSGRQLIVETHSEHLVNRMRLHAARDESSSIAELISLVFAERDPSTGETTYRNVAVNEYGGLSEWPDRFMSEGIHDAKELLERGLAKLDARAQGG